MLFFILKTFCSPLNSWIGELDNSFFDVTNGLQVEVVANKVQLFTGCRNEPKGKPWVFYFLKNVLGSVLDEVKIFECCAKYSLWNLFKNSWKSFFCILNRKNRVVFSIWSMTSNFSWHIFGLSMSNRPAIGFFSSMYQIFWDKKYWDTRATKKNNCYSLLHWFLYTFWQIVC